MHARSENLHDGARSAPEICDIFMNRRANSSYFHEAVIWVTDASVCVCVFSLGWWRLYVDAIIGRPYHSVFIITHFSYDIFKLYRYLLYNTAIWICAYYNLGETVAAPVGPQEEVYAP